MGFLAKVFIIAGALGAILVAAAIAVRLFAPERLPYLHEAGAAGYLLALIAIWTAMHGFGWRLRRKTAGLAALTALAVVIVYGGLVYLTVRSWPQVLAVNPLQVLAGNANYLVAAVGSVVILLAIVSVLGLLLLRALLQPEGVVWGLTGLLLAVVSAAVAAGLGLQVYGVLRDPAMAALGARVMEYGLYGHIAAWPLTSFALYCSLGATPEDAAKADDAAATETPADDVTEPARERDRAPSSDRRPSETEAATEPPAAAPEPAAPPAPRPLAADERTVRATPPSDRDVVSKPAAPSGEAKPVTVVRRPGVQPDPGRPGGKSPVPSDSVARPASEDDPTVRNSPPAKPAPDAPGAGDRKD